MNRHHLIRFTICISELIFKFKLLDSTNATGIDPAKKENFFHRTPGLMICAIRIKKLYCVLSMDTDAFFGLLDIANNRLWLHYKSCRDFPRRCKQHADFLNHAFH